MKKVLVLLVVCFLFIGCKEQTQVTEPQITPITFTVIFQGYKYEHLRRSNLNDNTFIRENGKQIVFGGNYMAVQE